ncbi:MAG: hypothetical protein R3C03_14975 [Pirellulaceae bacterium]
MASDINVLALAKGEERYLFLFNDENRAETLRMLGRYASNPDLSFSWYDAAVMSQKIRATRKSKSTDNSSTGVVTNRLKFPPVSDLFPNE